MLIKFAVSAARGLFDARIARVLEREDGQDLMEYAILGGAIVLVAAIALFAMNPTVWNTFAAIVKNCVSFSNACK